MQLRLLFIFALLSTIELSAQSLNFTADTTTGCVPLQVNFSSTINNAQQYHWQFGDGAQSTVASPQHLYVDPGTYTVKLVVTTSTGVDSVVKNSYIRIDSIPQLNYSISSFSQCLQNDSVTFTNHSNPAHSYRWSMGDGNVVNSFETTYKYQAVGQYQTTLFATTAAGCTNSKTINRKIEVKPSPQVDFSVDTTLVCSDNQVIQFASMAASNLTHYWGFGDGIVDSVNRNTQHIYQNQGEYTVSLTVVDATNCSATEVKNALITYHEPSSPFINLNQDTICEGVEVKFELDTNWVSAYWNFGNNDTSSQMSPSYNYASTGKFVPKVNLIDSFGCRVSETLDTIEVHESPVANIRDTAFTACAPYTVNLKSSSFFANSYSWLIDSTSYNSNNINHTFSEAGNFDLQLIANNSFCSDTLVVKNFADIESASAEVEVNDSSGCAPLEVDFSLQGGPFSSVKWDFGNGDTSVLFNPSYTYLKGGMYHPQVITETENGCVDTNAYSPGIQVIDAQSVFSLPDTVFLCEPGFVYFNGYSVGGSFWEWDFGDGDSSVLANPSHYFDSAGTYVVELLTENTNGCYYRLKPYNVVVVKDQELDFNFTVTSCPFRKVEFFALDSTAVKWYWEFGDSHTDTVENPIHFYPEHGFYNVSLSTWDEDGCYKKHTKLSGVQVFKCVGGIPQSNGLPGTPAAGGGGGFTDSTPPIRACAPFEIEMVMPYDSMLNQWWSFGDGQTSQLKEPTHLYTSGGSYTVKLITEYPAGVFDTIINRNFIQLSEPKSRFSYDIENRCDSSLVNFFNQSTAATEYNWNLGEAGTSTKYQPSAIYRRESNQLIDLTIKDGFGCIDQTVKNLTVGSPNPYFNFPANSCLGETVYLYSNIQFFDSLSWDINGRAFQGDTLAFLPPDTGEYIIKVKAFDQSGCFQVYTASKTLKVHDPQAEFVINGMTEKCDFLDVQLSNLSTGANRYLWYFGENDSSDLKTPNKRLTQEGEFTLRLVAMKGGCTSEKIASEKLIVNKAKADFSVTQNEKCLPIQVQFHDQSDSAISWNWTFGDGDSSQIKDPKHTYHQEPGTQSLKIVDNNGCVGEITKSAIELHRADPIANRWEGCVPLLVQFDDTTANVVEYKWIFGDGDSSNLQSPQHIYENVGTYDLTLITRSVEGCYDTAFISEAVVAGKVNADFSSSSEGRHCAPHLVEIENNSTGAVNYHWNFGDGKSSTQENAKHVYHAAGHFNVTLIADNGHSCSDTLIKTNRFLVNTPEINFSMSDTAFCGPTEVQFTDNSKRVANRTWYFGDGQTSQDQSPTHLFQDTGLYKVNLVVTDTAQCSEYLTKTVRINQKPTASFSLDSIYGCAPVAMGFRNHSYGLQNASFHWKIGKKWLKNTFDTTISFTKQGGYDVGLIAINQNKCKDTLLKEDHLEVYESVEPQQPKMLSVSRGLDQSWVLNWEKNQAFQFQYYRIWRKKADGNYEEFITIADQERTSYQISYRSNWESRQCFKIEVIYHCFPALGPDSLVEYCSIDLSAKVETNFIQLNWTPYFDSAFDYYELWRKSIYGGQFEKIARLSDSTLSYRDTTILCPEAYQYKVSAASSSNSLIAYSDTAVALPKGNTLDSLELMIKRATVVDEYTVLLEWENFNLSPQVVDYIKLDKQQSRGGFVMLEQLSPDVSSFLDQNAEAGNRAMQYVLTVVDRCKANLKVQERASSIHLEVKQNGNQHQLRWTAAKGIKGGVETYLIQRLDSDGNWKDVKRVSAEQLETILEAE